MLQLPSHSERRYDPAGICIYCGQESDLTDEHIVPLGLGGRWVYPRSSCRVCAVKTGAAEGTCLRTMLGPLRMLLDLPSRRKKERPKTLPLKVKYKKDGEWERIEVDRKKCPFLLLLPLFRMPDELSGYTTNGNRGAAASKFWIRGTSGPGGVRAHLQALAEELGVVEIEPTADFVGPEFVRMLAKIAHSYAVAELGLNSFEALLPRLICEEDTSNSVQYIGGLQYSEPASPNLHELGFGSHTCDRPDLVSVRVRLLAPMETPTYFVVVGRRKAGPLSS